MFTIADLLNKFKDFKDPEDDKKIVVELIKTIAGIPLTTTEITFKSNKLYLKIHPGLKNVVFMHKPALLHSFSDKIKNRLITDIV